jgi:GNAT superfamily N-acetyltransferase
MADLAFLRYGQYLLYERYNCDDYDALNVDSNVQILKNVEKIRDAKFGIDLNNMEKLLKNGATLFVYFEDDQPLGMMCGYHGPCYIRGPGIPLQNSENTVYRFWTYTLPEARRKNVYKKLKNNFFAYYKGVTKFTSLVDPANTIMRKEMQKMGFNAVKLFSFVKFGEVSLIYSKDLPSKKGKLSIELGNQHNLMLI